MVRQSPRSRPDTLERPRIPATRKGAKPPLAHVAREISHGRTTIVLARVLAHPAPRVWTMVTEPAQLALWSPYTADRNLAHVGRATLTMLDGGNGEPADIPSVVFVADTPHSLEHSWADDTIAWSLSNDDQRHGTRLELRQTLANDSFASAVAAGWHLCLDVAESVLDGHPVPPIRGAAAMDHGWADLNRRYATALGVKPTRIG
jgi:uncharacterized protein YndB with AHSA1/START domain